MSNSEINKLNPSLLFICRLCNENEFYNTNSLHQKSTNQNINSESLKSQIIIIISEISPAKTPSVQNNFPAIKVIQGPRYLTSEPTQSTVQSSSSIQKPVEETRKSHKSNATSDHQMRPKQSARQRTATKSKENKTYIMELDKRIREHEKTLPPPRKQRRTPIRK